MFLLGAQFAPMLGLNFPIVIGDALQKRSRVERDNIHAREFDRRAVFLAIPLLAVLSVGRAFEFCEAIPTGEIDIS